MVTRSLRLKEFCTSACGAADTALIVGLVAVLLVIVCLAAAQALSPGTLSV